MLNIVEIFIKILGISIIVLLCRIYLIVLFKIVKNSYLNLRQYKNGDK